MAGLGQALLRYRCKPAGPKSVNACALKALLVLLVALVTPVRSYSQDSLRIEAIGLSGYYSTTVSVAVQIHLPASPQPESLRLDFAVRSSYFDGACGIVRTDHFFKTVSLPAGRVSDLEVPVLIPQTPIGEVDVTATTPDRRVVGSAKRDLKALAQIQHLVAVSHHSRHHQRHQPILVFGVSSQRARHCRQLRHRGGYDRGHLDHFRHRHSAIFAEAVTSPEVSLPAATSSPRFRPYAS